MDRRYAKYPSLEQSHGIVCEHSRGKGLDSIFFVTNNEHIIELRRKD